MMQGRFRVIALRPSLAVDRLGGKIRYQNPVELLAVVEIPYDRQVGG